MTKLCSNQHDLLKSMP